MNSPLSKNSKEDGESDMFHSDKTLVIEYQEHGPKMKHLKRKSEDSQNTPSQASQSVLMVKKKKYCEMSAESGSDNNKTSVKKKKEVTVNFCTQELFKQPSSKDCVNSPPKKRKKIKNNISDNSNYCTISPNKIKKEKELSSPVNHEMPSSEKMTKKEKKRKVSVLDLLNLSDNDNTEDNTIGFSAQELIKHPSSEDSVNSTPKKSKKKKNKDSNINNVSDDSDGTMSSIKKIKKELSSPINHTLELLSSEHVTEKEKNKKVSRPNLLNLSEDNIISDFGEQSIFSSEEFMNFPPRKSKKKKNRDLIVNSNDDSDNTEDYTEAAIMHFKKELNSVNYINGHELSLSEHVTKKSKKKKVNEPNLVNLNEDDSTAVVNSTSKKLNKKKRDNLTFRENYIKQNKDGLNLTKNDMDDGLAKKDKKEKFKLTNTTGLNLNDNTEHDTFNFCTQDIFNLPDSEEFVNSTPKKHEKKKRKESEVNGNDAKDSKTSPIKEIQDTTLNVTINDEAEADVILTEPFTKKNKKKKFKLTNTTGLNLNDNTEHDTFNFCTQDIFNLPDSEEFVNSTPKKHEKKKRKESEVNGNDAKDSKTSPIKEIQDTTLNVTINDEAEADVILTEPFTKKNKKKKFKLTNTTGLNLNDNTEHDTFNFCTQDIFNLPDSKEFVNSTPEKHEKKKIKESEVNGNDAKDSKTSPIKEIQDNALNVTINDQAEADVNLPEPFTKKVKKKRNKGHNLNETGPDSNTFKHSDSFDNSFSPTSDASDLAKLHTSFNISSDNSQAFSELEDSEIDIPCRKHKKKKHKEALSNDISEKKGIDKSEHFFCQFCISSVNNIRTNGSKTENEDILENRNDKSSFDIWGDKIKKKKTKKFVGEKSEKNNYCVLDLLDKYLDTKESWLNDDNLPSTDVNSPLPSNIADSKVLDPLCDFDGTTDRSDKNDIKHINQTNDGKTDKKQDEKEKQKVSSNTGVENGHPDVLDSRLDICPSIDDNNDGQDILGVNRVDNISDFGIPKDENNIEDSQRRSEDETNISLDNTKLVRRTSESSSISIDLSDDHWNRSEFKRDRSKSDEENMSTTQERPKRKRKIKRICSAKTVEEDSQNTSDDDANTSKKNSKLGKRFSRSGDSSNSSGCSNGNDAHFDSDSNEEVEKMNMAQMLKPLLKNLTINIDFEIPELHKICNRASKPTPQQRKEAYQKNISIKLGKFVKAEDDKIKENWRKFIQVHNFEDVPEVFFSLDRKYISVEEKQNFLYYIAQGFNERPPFFVYRRFKRLMSTLKYGKFTEEEDKYILKQVEENRCHRYYKSDIAQHLQRPYYSIEKRIQRLESRHTRKIRWRKSNLVAFIKYLLKITGTDSDDVEALKNRHISSTQWTRLSKKLDGVPVRILKRAWLENIHPMLFIPNNRCDLRHVKMELIRMLCENEEKDWRAVNWNSYASHFEGLTSSKIYATIKQLVVYRVPLEKRKNLKKCLKILSKLKEQDLGKMVFIYKIKYQDGQIIQVGKNGEKTKKKTMKNENA